ncbi:MAG TPA: UDP-N-acetylmuramoyl-L-alanyl-D-glutamate--2,6-diaminopimelate ligase [Thermoanaerobaculia bacterium]|nr:UDP-N-acetylmuramoyl-L-alanyl-D-glutamate--2,6-diaminopimelate ligase [Thermoanaerobaculia bacterium]
MAGGGDMVLEQLVEDLPVAWASGSRPRPGLEIAGVCHDSRRVEPGDLFVTWKGDRWDGASFVEEAARRGAVAVLTDPRSPVPLLPWLVAPEPRTLLAPLASRVYEHPDRELLMAGVTGTNGKSTVVALLAALLEAAGCASACLGTLGYRFRDLEFPGERTTPEASDLHRVLRRARDAGAMAAVMEVSSHALVQGRVDCATFDLGVFLNLSRDHLDFHPTMDDYFAAKAALFERLGEDGRAAISVDCPWGQRLAALYPRAITFGDRGAVRFRDLRLDAKGIAATVETPRGEVAIQSRLLGAYNARNLLAAIAATEAIELDHEVYASLPEVERLPGRMEPVELGQPFPVIVDYAHTDGALRAALEAVRGLGGAMGTAAGRAGDRVVVVFGCGGDRDRGKRPLMGRAAGELADHAILTSDNPRSEDPMAILAAIEEGIAAVPGASWEVVPDRREAIRRAIALADPGTSVLIAGKGHERVQLLGDRSLPFVDRDEAARAIEERLEEPRA